MRRCHPDTYQRCVPWGPVADRAGNGVLPLGFEPPADSGTTLIESFVTQPGGAIAMSGPARAQGRRSAAYAGPATSCAHAPAPRTQNRESHNQTLRSGANQRRSRSCAWLCSGACPFMPATGSCQRVILWCILLLPPVSFPPAAQQVAMCRPDRTRTGRHVAEHTATHLVGFPPWSTYDGVPRARCRPV